MYVPENKQDVFDKLERIQKNKHVLPAFSLSYECGKDRWTVIVTTNKYVSRLAPYFRTYEEALPFLWWALEYWHRDHHEPKSREG